MTNGALHGVPGAQGSAQGGVQGGAQGQAQGGGLQGPPAAAPHDITQEVDRKPDIMAISLASRLPEFWVDQPRVWFIRIEAILSPQRLGDDARFDLVVAKLPKEVILQFTDFLSRPPATGKFAALKAKLLSLYEDTRIRQVEKLIGDMELGEMKPSQLLNRMKDLARENFPDETLRILWQGRLPGDVRAVLAVAETNDLDRLASIADNVVEATHRNYASEVRQPARSYNTPQAEGTAPTTSKDTAVILAEIAKLSVRLANVERSGGRQANRGRQGQRYGRSTSRARNTSRNRSKSRAKDNPNWLCFYHFRYAEKANKCFQPCAWGSSVPEN